MPNIFFRLINVEYSSVMPMESLNFDEDIYNTIRNNISKYRKEKGITSAQLAEMVGLSHDFIRQIQSKKAAYNFSVETFYKISVALGVSMDTLAENKTLPEPPKPLRPKSFEPPSG